MSDASGRNNQGLISAIIVAGLIAGTLDILSAFTSFYISTGKSPVIVLNYISSAVFGKEAYSGGGMMSAVGLLFHYIIAFGWTILFFILYPKLSFLRGNKFVVGLAYGVFVWVMMNQVIVPMTQIPARPFNLNGAITNAIILMFAIGLPVSILANRYYSRHS
ncbi:MAG: hypothetical protein HOP08_15645 [Cyclobacteriaceae bacterium]|nr:hypothetical protein [Cyclobacteriaceae bacterium]